MSDISYFTEVDVGYPDIMKKQKTFHFVLKINLFLNIMII